MQEDRGNVSRRDVLGLAALAAGAAPRAQAGQGALAGPAAPVSVAKVAGYDQDLVAQVALMFDQAGA